VRVYIAASAHARVYSRFLLGHEQHVEIVSQLRLRRPVADAQRSEPVLGAQAGSDLPA
jgi:hypothetical protein